MLNQIVKWAYRTAVAFGMVLSVSGVAASEETTLNLITGWPQGSFFNEPLLKFVDEVNERGKGVVQIRFVGGPEVTPLSEQIGSLDLGINQMWYGTISAFLSRIPESRALVLSDYTAMELRERGSYNKIAPFFDKANLHFLSYFGSGYTFHIYMRDEPKRTADGGVDLTGMRIRAPRLYQPLMNHINATPINIEVAELYEGLSRGRVDGYGWLDIGLTDFSWQDYTKYRITPNFWQGDVSVLLSTQAWESLSQGAKDILTETGIKYERIAHEYMLGLKTKELEKLRSAGMQDVPIEGKAADAYLRAATSALWDEIEATSGKESRDILEAEFTKQQ